MFIVLGHKPWRVVIAGLVCIALGVYAYEYFDAKERSGKSFYVPDYVAAAYQNLGKGGICGVFVALGVILIAVAMRIPWTIGELAMREAAQSDPNYVPPAPQMTWMGRPVWYRLVTAGSLPLVLGILVGLAQLAIGGHASAVTVLALGLIGGGLIPVAGGAVLRLRRPDLVQFGGSSATLSSIESATAVGNGNATAVDTGKVGAAAHGD